MGTVRVDDYRGNEGWKKMVRLWVGGGGGVQTLYTQSSKGH